MASIIWSAVNSAIVPDVFINLEKNNYTAIRKTTKSVLTLMAGATIISTIIAPELLSILTTKEYHSAVYIMPAIMIGVFFTAVYSLYGNVLIFYKKSTLVMLATVGAAIINIVLNYIFINIYGYKAAAYTTFASFIVLAFFQWLMQNKICKEQIVSLRFLFGISLSVTVVCLLMNLIYSLLFVRIMILAILALFVFIYRKEIIKLMK